MGSPPVPELPFVDIAEVLIELGIFPFASLSAGPGIAFVASQILPPVIIDTQLPGLCPFEGCLGRFPLARAASFEGRGIEKEPPEGRFWLSVRKKSIFFICHPNPNKLANRWLIPNTPSSFVQARRLLHRRKYGK